MTLCTAWLRKANNSNELIFVTDSCLSGGERWNTGIKLFDFHRKDCLICFAGETYRAYPLIMNAKHLIMSDPVLSNPNTSIQIVKDELLSLFTELTDKIYNLPKGENIEDIKAVASFLFGGWDYLDVNFKVWYIHYYAEGKKFIADDIFFDDSRPAFFMGDNTGEAEEKLLSILSDNKNTEDVKLDMEPFTTITRISLDPNFDSIAGPLQLAKVYKSGSSEFFGVISSKGNPTLHGQEYNHYSKPVVKYIDTDSASILQEELPKNISNINPKYFSNYKDFIESCYDQEKNLKELTGIERERLVNVLKDISYNASLNNESLFLPSESSLEERNG